jgi:hypothetical protein
VPQVATSAVELRAARPIQQAHTTLADLGHWYITLQNGAPVLRRWTWAGARERGRIRSTIGDVESPSSIRVMRSDPLVMLGRVTLRVLLKPSDDAASSKITPACGAAQLLAIQPSHPAGDAGHPAGVVAQCLSIRPKAPTRRVPIGCFVTALRTIR